MNVFRRLNFQFDSNKIFFSFNLNTIYSEVDWKFANICENKICSLLISAGRTGLEDCLFYSVKDQLVTSRDTGHVILVDHHQTLVRWGRLRGPETSDGGTLTRQTEDVVGRAVPGVSHHGRHLLLQLPLLLPA